MSQIRRSILVVGFLTFTMTNTFAQDVTMRRLTDRVIVLNVLGLDSITHIVVISSQKGLVVIDTEISPYVMNILKQAAEKHFKRNDWAYVINTHGHIHHVFGNVLFRDIPIIGHERMRTGFPEKGIFSQPKKGEKPRVSYSGPIARLRQMQRTSTNPTQTQLLRRRIRLLTAINREWKAGFEKVPPNITFRDRLTLDLGDVHLRLIDWGEGINHSSILIHILEDNIIVSQGGRWLPDIGSKATLSSIRRYISVLKELVNEEVHIDTVIPCHTEFATKEDLQAQYDYISDMLDGIAEAKQKGLSLQQVKEQFSLERYARLSRLWLGRQPEKVSEKHQNNIDRIWNCMQQED